MMNLLRLPAAAMVAALCLARASDAQVSVSVTVPGTSNPFLAGQPAGVSCCGGDSAPAEAPVLVPIAVCGGESYRIAGISGLCDYVPSSGGYPPEGHASWSVASGPALGISMYTIPVCALLGVFMPQGVNSGAAPAGASFSTPAERDFEILTPALFQTFFIGDGLRLDGVTLQTFVAPAGATRLFLGICDGSGWYNNSGSFAVTVSTAWGTAASVVDLGGGCGAAVPPVLTATPPRGCATCTITVTGATPGYAGILALSLPAAAPLVLGGGCTLHVNTAVFYPVLFTATPAGEFEFAVPMPPHVAVMGIEVTTQAAILGTAGSLGFDLSNGLSLTCGF